MTEVHVVLPNDIDDPATPSGGNVYDRRLCASLATMGWSTTEHPVPGAWPYPLPADRAGLARVLGALPDDAVVLLDGLVASAVPDVLLSHANRLREVVLVHMPLRDAAEREALGGAPAVIATSEWTRSRLLEEHGLPADRVHVAPPGVDPAPLAPGTDSGSRLLCVAAVTAPKGHDLLAAALATLPEARCVCVGPVNRDPGFVTRLRTDRLRLAGPLTGTDLDAAYAAADLLVLPSRGEAYGMVVTEALAVGLPVLATAVGGVPEALGRTAHGVPGLLVPPGDAGRLGAALGAWLRDGELRARLRRTASERRTTLEGWDATAAQLAAVLVTAGGPGATGANGANGATGS
jgi:glycosyltransferase involved in cell wall biosynthesis